MILDKCERDVVELARRRVISFWQDQRDGQAMASVIAKADAGDLADDVPYIGDVLTKYRRERDKE